MQKAQREQYGLDLWMVIGYVFECSASLQLPLELLTVFRTMQTALLSEHVFISKSSAFTYLLEGGGCLHLPGETTMIGRFLLAYAYNVLEHAERLAKDVVRDAHQLQVMPMFMGMEWNGIFRMDGCSFIDA